MKKNLLCLTLLMFITMLSVNAFAETPPPDKKVGLDDAIRILKYLAGEPQPPGFDATGTWAVQSVQNGEKRTGEVFLKMLPEGQVTGYAELTSLPGLSTVTGRIHGLRFDLHLVSDFGAMDVNGTANAEGDSISGSFFLQDNVEVFWDGQKQLSQTFTGTYQHDTIENKLVLVFEDETTLPFSITEFTDKKLVLNNYAIWNRSEGGITGNLVGIWRNLSDNVEQIFTFYEDGTFSNIQRLIQQ
ncbi:conserved hypothetical protein, secreted [Candidatus Magnetomorum sp. HK-1]|nr:conserved hypothetical protein, secreted [Candidatus Magnetomorum sp. HK-1]